jgi:hypothetical protein
MFLESGRAKAGRVIARICSDGSEYRLNWRVEDAMNGRVNIVVNSTQTLNGTTLLIENDINTIDFDGNIDRVYIDITELDSNYNLSVST